MANEQNQNAQGTSARQAKEENFSNENANVQNKQSSGTSETQNAKDKAKDIYEQAKDTAGQAYGTAAKKAKSNLEEQKSKLSGSLASVADSIHQISEDLRKTDEENKITGIAASYGDNLAQQVENISQYFERKDLREMARDVEGFARRNPAIFIGAAFALGLLTARFLKSSNSGQTASRRAGGQQDYQSLDVSGRNFDDEFNKVRSLKKGDADKGQSITDKTPNPS